MGSMPRLKIKDEIRYRKGSTNDSKNCKACGNFKKDFYEFHRPVGLILTESRCALIGMREGRRYRVREDYTCDRQQMSEHWRQEIDQFMTSMQRRKENDNGNGKNYLD
jgi:hypothetical protein